MSKLQFKEVSYFDVKDGSGGEDDQEEEEDQDASDTSDRKSSRAGNVMSSYELFGMAATSTTTTTNGGSSIDHAADSGEDSRSSLNHEKVKKKKKKKRKKRDSSSVVVVVPADDTTSSSCDKECSTSTAATDDDRSSIIILDGHRSNFISKFLSQRRTSHPDITVPVIEPSNARYLQQFLDHFTRDDAARRGGDAVDALQETTADDYELSVEGSGSPEYDPTSFGRDHPSDEVDELFLTHEASVSASALLEDTTDSCGTVKLQLFNLPYKVSVKEIEEFASRYDCSLEQIVLGLDKKSKAPNGTATAQLTGGTGSVQDRIQSLQGERCGGRPVKVLRYRRDAPSRRSSGSECGRYFADDISCKCHLCGEVGHRQQDCTNDPLPTPCHLCAGKDHDAGSCPNITCYRCGNFGHHSRDCRNAPMAKAVMCTHCGSTTHDIRQCREVELGSKVTGPLARCMSCDGWGHTMCSQLLPAVREQKERGEEEQQQQQVTVFCPNCGEANHHIDYPGVAFCVLAAVEVGAQKSSGGTQQQQQNKAHNPRKRAHESSSSSSSLSSSSVPVKTSCIEPRYDAFNKFPQLLKELSCRESEDDRNQLYRDLLPRYPSRIDLLMFPSLCSSNNNNQQQQSRHGGGGYGSSDTVTQGQQNNGRIVVISGSSVDVSSNRSSTRTTATGSSAMLETVTQRYQQHHHQQQQHEQHSDRRRVSVEYGPSNSSSFIRNNYHTSSLNHGPQIHPPHYPLPHHNVMQVPYPLSMMQYNNQYNNYHPSSLNHGPPIHPPHYPPNHRNTVFLPAPPSHAPPPSTSINRAADESFDRKLEARKMRFAHASQR